MNATASSIRVERPARVRASRTAHRTRAIELAVVAVAIVATFVALTLTRPVDPGDVETTTRLVEQGDTLWALAQSHPVEGLSTEQTAGLIASLNGLESSTLHAGSAIKVPSTRPEAPRTAMR